MKNNRPWLYEAIEWAIFGISLVSFLLALAANLR